MSRLALPLLLVSACSSQTKSTKYLDVEAGTPDTSILMAHAGESAGGTHFYYFIDRRAQTCWFSTRFRDGAAVAHTLAPLDCCKLRAVPELAAELGFASCDAPNASAP
jgi:hypothetical protein